MDSLGPQKEFSALLDERDFLRGRLGELSAEREHCLLNEGKNLSAEYYEKIGFLEVECLMREIACARLKREIEFITAAQNRGGTWDYDEITIALDKEFEEWQLRLAAETAKLEASRLQRITRSRERPGCQACNLWTLRSCLRQACLEDSAVRADVDRRIDFAG